MMATRRMRTCTHMRTAISCNVISKPTIFQVDPPLCPISISDVQDLLEVSHGMSENNKRDYFYANGVDYNKVIEYYDIVLKLNNSIDKRIDIQSHLKTWQEQLHIFYIVFLLMMHFLFSRRPSC